MNTLATILLLMGLVQATQKLDGNQLLFTVIGETTRENGYAHLVVPLPIPALGQTVDTLHDIIKTFGELTCCGVMSLHHSHSSLLRSKITLKRSQNTLKQAETVFQPSVYR